MTDLLQEENRCLVHAINVCEVYYDLYCRDGEEIANGFKEVELSSNHASSLSR